MWYTRGVRDVRGTSLTRSSLAALALGAAVLACGGGAAKTAAPRTTYTCGLQVSKKAGEPYTAAPAFAGEASSEVSSAEACEAALADACAKAGAPGDCLAAGYEKQGEVISKTRRLAKP